MTILPLAARPPAVDLGDVVVLMKGNMSSISDCDYVTGAP
jgi:hypothetical protein